MFSPKSKLIIPENFEFPFEPYKIQNELMKSLYSILENKQIGIFESPTGTGKSLTLTASSIKWLVDHENLVKNEIQEQIVKSKTDIEILESISSTDWIETQSRILQEKGRLANLIKTNKILNEKTEKIRNIIEKVLDKENFDSDNIQEKNSKKKVGDIEISEDSETSDSDSHVDSKEIEKDDTQLDIKIFYCSRTHSQLSQVVREIKRISNENRIRCISLASRQNLCINESVCKLNSVHLINEKCLEMQRASKPKTQTSVSPPKKKARTAKIKKCLFKNNKRITNLKDSSISEIFDIEDLILEAKKENACPYYSSRLAIEDAQVIMLPYQILFHRSTRLQSGISLKNNIVIVDEAHNLLDTLSNIYSAGVDLIQLNSALVQLTKYKERYFNKFSTNNLLKINQIIFIVKRLIKIMCEESKIESKMIKTHELMSEGDFFNINIFEILKFCENSHFAEKVHSFAKNYIASGESCNEKLSENKFSGIKGLLKKIEGEVDVSKDRTSENAKEKVATDLSNYHSSNVIRPLISFLDCLTECSDDGGVIITYTTEGNKNPSMKFVLLNPSRHFKDLVEECRSIIIAGGTMQPVNDLVEQLFSKCMQRVKIHIYGHVVPKESILPIAVSEGPSGQKFLFNFQNRCNEKQQQELAQTICNISNIIPAGIVCFVPSYDYLENFWSYLKRNNYLTVIEKKKFVFRETKSSMNNSVEKLLTQYSNSIKDRTRNGAFMISVVGGKLSEGLNFSDELGRCVMVVGLPYPNKTSFELQEKMKYLNEKLGKNAGNEYYENLCLKAVNQCIGRSIRHINDYAVVLLVDQRYSNDRITKKLPGWILESFIHPENYAQIHKSIAKFFEKKKK
ncbi:ATP-dependent DNA helicase DDX11 [Condylostylus longicornis]|uniref:ATP-dependent DNA helicase DDX11 n=1 Tax=Condylostylus longicornis TaxID=2530218 RepID=UPI00244DD9E3|nr:ATP-dependent DNA helicase DDX11 [Condylostylus longicornis]